MSTSAIIYMMKRLFSILLPAFLLLGFSTHKAAAQNEIEVQQSSLRGIGEFYVAVNVEGNDSLAYRDPLGTGQIRQGVLQQLKEAGLPVIGKDDMNPNLRYPYLLVHLNVMHAGRGIVPFAVNLNFYQPVKLSLNRDKPFYASTWNTGNVGVVSLDQLPVIPESIHKTTRVFIEDFQMANQ